MGQRRRAIFWLTGLVSFGVSASVATMSPFFPQEAEARGMSATTASLVFGAYPLSALIASALMARLVPFLGPKAVFVGGSVAIGVGNITFGLLIYVRDLHTFTIYCFVIRVLMGIGSGANITAIYTYVASTFTEKISVTLGLLEVFASLGLCAGPALGGLLFEVGGYSMPFYAVGAFLLLLLPINICVMPKIKGHARQSLHYGRALCYFPVYITLGSIAMVTTVFAFLEATLAQHMTDRFALTPRSIGLVFLLFAVCYGLSSVALGRLSDRLGRHRLLMVGGGLVLGALATAALSPPPVVGFIPRDELWVALLSLCLGSVFLAATMIPTFAVLCDLVKGPLAFPDDVKTDALVSAAFQTFFYVGCVAGAGSSGHLTERFGYGNGLGVVSAVIMFWGLLTIITAAALSCCCPSTNRHQTMPAEDKASANAAPDISAVTDDPDPTPRPKPPRPENLDLSQLSIRESGGYKTFLPEIGSLSPPPERAELLMPEGGVDRSSAEEEPGGPRAGVTARRTAKTMEESAEGLAERRWTSRERVAQLAERAAAKEEVRIAEMIKNADLSELQELLRSPVEAGPENLPPW